MAEQTSPATDTQGRDYQQGPKPSPGGEIDVDERVIPPYEGRTPNDPSDDASDDDETETTEASDDPETGR